MAGVRFEKVSKRYGPVTAVRDFSLEIASGEFVTFLGPSGSGKTTLLRIVAGLLEASEGVVMIGNRDVTHLPPQKRNIGMVFQQYALFPHLTVFENIAFGLRERRLKEAEIRRRVEELLDAVGLLGYEDRYPKQLSGGQQQRVALARALSINPSVLLMDEPLAALDLKLRQHMQMQIKRIQGQLAVSVVYVTHDQTEAFNMSDRVVVMNHGVAEQVGTPEEVYRRPKTLFTAQFVGEINLLPIEGVSIGKDVVRTLLWGKLPMIVPRGCVTNPASSVLSWAGIRPEDIRVEASAPADESLDEPGVIRLESVIEAKHFIGPCTMLRVRVLEAQGVLSVRAHPKAAFALVPGARVSVVWDPSDVVLLEGKKDEVPAVPRSAAMGYAV